MPRISIAFICLGFTACGGDDDVGGGPADASAAADATPAADGYRSVTVGEHTSCDLTPDGAACWGRNPFGVLGRGDEEDSPRPVPVAGEHDFRQISAGPIHVCALDAAGAAWCWGSNSTGQGGTGSTEGPNLEPEPVTGGLVFVQISAGYDHTCAVAEGGAAYCWGNNGYGQLGNGVESDLEVEPTPVAGGMSFRQISAANSFTCAVTTEGDGTCWGLDSLGQLGDGGEITGMTTSLSREPVALAGGLSLQMVSGGQQSACAVDQDGGGHCWGRNDVGRLGDDSDVDSSSPVRVVGLHEFETITTGGTHACGLTSDGAAFCWGANTDGQLGVAEPADLSRAPVPVSGG
ncbi:MAG TPA: hypothetical protein VFU21_03480, partial [Kofleriaceae bacterium]|nr:hypothetical protein [Kofleriaceae bacterium]